MNLRILDRPIRNIHTYLVRNLRTKPLKTLFLTPSAPLGARKRAYLCISATLLGHSPALPMRC